MFSRQNHFFFGARNEANTHLYSFLLAIISYIPPLQAFQTSEKNQIANQGHIKKILLVVAMDTEAMPIIKALNLKKSSHSFSNLPMQGYTRKYNGFDIFLILNGIDSKYKVQNVGTQAATLTSYLGINYFHPDLVISIGTAGGIAAQGAKIGDVYISKKIYFYGRRIPGVGYKEYGLGGYDSANLARITNKMHIKSGLICSGDSFEDNQADRDIILKYGCSACEMEAASVAWVSQLTHTPMLAIKGITNIVGSETSHEDFKNHFADVTHTLAEKIKEFLSLLKD